MLQLEVGEQVPSTFEQFGSHQVVLVYDGDSEERVRMLSDVAPVMLWMSDTQGRYLIASLVRALALREGEKTLPELEQGDRS